MDSNKTPILEFYSVQGYKINTSPFTWVFETRDPTPSDSNYPQQKVWLNKSSEKLFVLTSFSSLTGEVEAVWQEVSSSNADLNTLTPDIGGAVSPVANNITVQGKASGAFKTSNGGAGVLEGAVLYDGTSITVDGLNQLKTILPQSLCSFRAHLTADAVGVTGNGATYTLSNMTELFDVGNNLDPVTGIFTVPATGKYCLMASISVTNLTVFMSSINCKIRNNTTGADVAIFNLGNPYARAGANSLQDLACVSVIDQLTAGDQIVVQAIVLNGAGDTADIKSGRGVSYFAGYFLGA